MPVDEYIAINPYGRRCWSWKFFVAEAEDRSKCMFCDFSYRNNTYKFKRHLLTQCKNIPPNFKDEITQFNTKTDHYYSTAKRPNFENPNETQHSGVSTLPQEPKYLLPMTDDTQIHKILSFIDQNTEERNQLQELLVKFIVTSNAAPEDLQNPHFREFLQKVQPDFNLPSSDDFKRLVEQQYDQLKPQINNHIKESKFLSLSIEESDENLNIFIHCPGPVYYGRLAVDQVKPFSIMERVLADVGAEKVVAIKAELADRSVYLGGIESSFPWIIFDGCKGCLIDATMEELVGVGLVNDFWAQCCFLAQFLRRPSVLPQFTEQNPSFLEIPLFPKTGSTVYRLFNAVSELRDQLNEAIWWPKLQEEPDILEVRQSIVENITFWDVVRSLTKLLRPFYEFDAGGDADYSTMLKRARKVLKTGLERAQNFDANCNQAFQEIIERSLKETETELGYVFDLLDHSTRGVELSDDHMDVAINLITNKIMANPSLGGDEITIIREIGEFRGRTGTFDENRRSWLKSLNEETSPVFWSYFQNIKLATIANLLSYVPFSSAICSKCKKKPEISEELNNKLIYLKHNLRHEEREYAEDQDGNTSNVGSSLTDKLHL
ncbi:unnamed protein product [Bursaphelenchus xylophilus]|uniref:(pine wood nematode) hypothetical protein n=1 Tax=Bursaphelenchus xylophilus TaxID=6326 RepID=A0A1I7S1H6_BURXY|nr:unnamed protein product [Bursaphelenchus xylophilus]CAG9081480.1 unnamed protein product [Bursaphelenchus xylophilus]